LEDKATPGQAWGGRHITIIGRGNTKQSLRFLKNIQQVTHFNKNSNKWTLHSQSNLRPVMMGNQSTLCFDSDTLDNLSRNLVGLNYTNVKGLQGNSIKKKPWHLSVRTGSEAQQIQFFSAQHHQWHLTICKESIDAHGNKVYNWEKL